MGGLITVVSLDKKIKQPARWLLISFIVALVAGLVHFILLQQGNYLFSLGYGHGQSLYYEHVWVYTLLNLVFAGLILSLVSASANESMRRLFEAGWLVQIGKVSYGMYVFHWAILVYVFRGAFNAGNYTKSLLFFPLYLLVVFLVSAGSYYFFELKFIRLKDRWFPSKKVSPEMR